MRTKTTQETWFEVVANWGIVREVGVQITAKQVRVWSGPERQHLSIHGTSYIGANHVRADSGIFRTREEALGALVIALEEQILDLHVKTEKVKGFLAKAKETR